MSNSLFLALSALVASASPMPRMVMRTTAGRFPFTPAVKLRLYERRRMSRSQKLREKA